MDTPFKPSNEDLRNFIYASLITGFAFFGFFRDLSFRGGVFSLLMGFLVLGLRELGQRSMGQLLDADIDLHLSVQGAAVTVLGGVASLVFSMPIILLFPVENDFSSKSHVQWGKSIDAVWMKRKFWIAYTGVIFLFLAAILSIVSGISDVAVAFLVFLGFQLLPFDYKDIPTGCLDGAYILRWSGFTWLVTVGTTLALLVVTL